MSQLYSFKEHSPKIHSSCFIAPNATLIGQVELGENANVWLGCVLRGDINKIIVGKNTNIQDLSMVHVVESIPAIIGDNVTIGHSAVIHACTIGNGSLIGMQACILDGAEIGEESVVAAGSLVPPGKKFPPRSMIMGNPAKVVRELRPEEIQTYSNHYKTYVENSADFLDPQIFKAIEK
jgi:carbonic anhydrase/acetyltransferase-like protein (isoleucine patch superfamily)